VAANTLIGLDKQDGQIKNLFIREKEEELAEVRGKYFSARSYPTKRKYRAKDKELRDEIADLLIDDGWATETAKQIAKWDPFDQNARSDWFDPEWMFGTKSFDVVIGNPPYIQLQKALPNGGDLKYADLYKNEGYKTFERTGDIYALFYERGLTLAKDGGLLCYITSNKWMRANYGKSLRKYFAQKNPLVLLDMGPGIFDSATVDTNILIIRDRKVRQHQLKAFPLEDKNQIHTLSKEEMTEMNQLSEESWIILKPEEMAIKEKIERIGTPLKDWDINIYRGVLTGYNEAFIIDGEKRKELIKQDPKSAEIIKPILRGRDIKRYKAEFADLWLIAAFPALNLNIEDYTAVEKHLKQFYPKIKQTGERFINENGIEERTRKKTNNKWFETQDQIGYYQEFEKEKVVWKIIGSNINFIIDTKGYYYNNAANILTSISVSLESLASFLNSKMFEWYFKNIIFIGVEGGGIQMFNTVMRKIPILKLSKSEIQPFEKLVNQILTKKENDEDTTAEEREIDVMVYKLYELTYDEVKIVDPEFWMSESEYEAFEVEKS
jgi:adenine-specific DNA-methyltransferase